MCLIFGLPGEPRNIVEKTINFIKEHQPDYVSLSGFCPFPGSPIYNSPKNLELKRLIKIGITMHIYYTVFQMKN